MTENDLNQVKQIIDLSFPIFYRFFATHSLHEEGQVIVGEIAGRIVGFAKLINFYIGGKKYGCILWIAVHPNFRRKGIAGSITSNGIQRLKQEGSSAVFASTQRRNVAALSVLSLQGFTLARKLGAQIYIDTNKVNASEELMKLGGARAIFCTAPNSKAISELVEGLSRNGQLIIITFVNEPMQISPVQLMRAVRSVSGWGGGNTADTLKFSVLTHVVPMVEVFPLEQASVAFDRMMTAKVHFRAVLKISEG